MAFNSSLKIREMKTLIVKAAQALRVAVVNQVQDPVIKLIHHPHLQTLILSQINPLRFRRRKMS